MPVTTYGGSFNILSGQVSLGEIIGGSIVTANLTHRFDAGNISSYPGSGTTWTNLAGYNN